MVLVLLIYMVIHSVQELNSNKTCLIVIPSSNAKQQNRNELQGFLFVREHLSYACSATLSQNLLACLLKFNCRPASDTQNVYLYTGKKGVTYLVQKNCPVIRAVHMPSAGRHQVHDVENLILELISKRCLCSTVSEHDQVGELTFPSFQKKKKLYIPIQLQLLYKRWSSFYQGRRLS